jgi:hypothetical protein
VAKFYPSTIEHLKALESVHATQVVPEVANRKSKQNELQAAVVLTTHLEHVFPTEKNPKALH